MFGLSDEKHAAGVAVKAVFDDGDVDIDGVAALQVLVAGNAVANDMIHGGADGLWEAAVVERGGNGILNVRNVFMADAIKLAGCYARLHIISNHIKDIGGQSAGDPHFVLLFRCFYRY